MALQPLPPIPNTRLVDDPARDAIWRRYLEQLFTLLTQINTTGIVGPGASTDNAIARWNGTTGQAIQNSGVIIDDSNSITGVSSFSAINGIFSGSLSSATFSVTSLAAARIPYTGTGGTLRVSDALQYTEATSTAVIHAIRCDASDGVLVEASNGTDVGIFGAGNTANTLLYGELNVSTNTTLGTVSSNSLTINAGTWTYNSNWTATRAVGAAAAGTTFFQQWGTTFDGDAGGTTDGRGVLVFTQANGANSITRARAMQYTTNVNLSAGTALNADALSGALNIINAGGVTNAAGVASQISISGTGNVTTGLVFSAQSPSLTSTGAFTTLTGFRAANLGHATLVTNAIGFDAVTLTPSATLTASYRSQQNSGTGVWGFYHTGTANNGFAGNAIFGTVSSTPITALDVRGGVAFPTRSVVSTYTAVNADYTILANASGAAFTVTLPHASTLPNKIYAVKKIDSTGNAVTVSSSSNIDGATTTSLAAQFNKIMIQSNNTQWYEI